MRKWLDESYDYTADIVAAIEKNKKSGTIHKSNLKTPNRGHGLMVECVLAKDETGVRFSLAALRVSYETTPKHDTE